MLYLQEQAKFPPLFDSVGCICICNGKILLLKRVFTKSYPGYWGIPGGKVESDESQLRAVIRELFEETGILLSSDNLKVLQKYHIVTEDMSFNYSVFKAHFESLPSVKIRKEEHIRYAWITPDDALRLDLIPDLDAVLKDALPLYTNQPLQLDLFTGAPSNISPTVITLEDAAKRYIERDPFAEKPKNDKVWYVSFGPPAAGKTTALKAMAKQNSKLQFVCENKILQNKSRLYSYLCKAFIEEERSFFFHFQMEVLTLRFWQTLNAPSQSLIDEAIFSTLAYSRALYRLGWLKEYEYQVFYCNYLTYFKFLPPPEIVFYFHCDFDTIKKRVKNRGRKIEGYFSDEYLQALCSSFAEVSTELLSEFNVTSIDTSELDVQKIVELYGPAKAI